MLYEEYSEHKAENIKKIIDTFKIYKSLIDFINMLLN